MKRDLYIDYAKGLATLSIVFIHTVFWSGQFYVSNEMRIFSLLFDVPIFFALSGLTSSGNLDKTVRRLLKLQITYMIFVTGLFFSDSFFKVFLQSFFDKETYQNFFLTFGPKYTEKSLSQPFDFKLLGNWWLHQYSTCDVFPVVMGSFWYLKTYYVVTFFGVIVLRFFSKYIWWIIGFCVVFIFVFNFNPDFYPTGQVGYTVFYLLVFLVAYQLKNKKLTNAQVLFLIGFVLFSLVGMFWSYGADIFYKLNKQKFPPKIPYIVWSFVSLAMVFIFYNRLKIQKENLLSYIGQNAIFFYFAQGISSSLVYFFIPVFRENLHWFVLMILIYALNILLAVIIAKFLKKIDEQGWKILNLLAEKIK